MKSKALKLLLAFAVAFGLWFYVITVVSPESEKVYYDIPVVLQNKNLLTERGLMVVSDEPKVTLALRSDRTILNDLNESNINVIINVANIEKPGVHNLTYSISYPGNIPENDISVQSKSTDLITLEVENRVGKTVPVVIDYGGTAVPDEYISKDPKLDYTEIEISGPESVVKQIKQAYIPVSLDQQTKTLVGDYRYTLCDGQGAPVNAEKITVNTEKVNLTVTVQRVKEIALKLDVNYGGGANEQNTTITQDLTNIQISGSDALLADYNELVLGTINLNEITEDQVLSYDIVLKEGVENLSGEDKVTVQISFADLVTKTFKVTNITVVNRPENLREEIITKALNVTVRGPEEVIKKLKDTDLRAEVDLSGAQLGTASMTANVIVSESYPDAGTVGTYQVSVKLREP